MKKSIELNRERFEACCKNLCTKQETADNLGVSVDTLSRWCKREYGKPYQDICASLKSEAILTLRQTGLELAKRNPAVWIFLAKNYLGMTDEPHPIDTGEAQQAFLEAMKIGVKAIERIDLTKIAGIDIPEACGQETE